MVTSSASKTKGMKDVGAIETVGEEQAKRVQANQTNHPGVKSEGGSPTDEKECKGKSKLERAIEGVTQTLNDAGTLISNEIKKVGTKTKEVGQKMQARGNQARAGIDKAKKIVQQVRTIQDFSVETFLDHADDAAVKFFNGNPETGNQGLASHAQLFVVKLMVTFFACLITGVALTIKISTHLLKEAKKEQQQEEEE